MTTIRVNTGRKTAINVLNANGVRVKDKEYTLKVFYDSVVSSPFEEWDGLAPLMYESGRYNDITDYSEGEIRQFLYDYLSDNQIIYHQKKIIDMCTDEHNYKYVVDDMTDLDKEEKIEYLRDDLIWNLLSDIEGMVKFCHEFNIKHYNNVSKGYSQGDWANVLIVPTEKYAKKIEIDLKNISENRLEENFKLFGYWAWGDVYGFRIEDENGEVLDNCGGFFGELYTGDVAEQMVDYIDLKTYNWNKEEVIERIKNADVNY